MNKMISLKDATKMVKDGDTVALGGFSVSRRVGAFARELVRKGVKNLTLVGTNLSFAMDMLVGAGCVKRVECGTGNLERFGVAYNFRYAVEQGELEVEDYSHLAMTTRFLAAELGLPFLPTRTFLGSDLMKYQSGSTPKYVEMKCPFSGDKVLLLPALKPDVAVIHANAVDELGNVVIYGSYFHDLHIARAAETVIVTAERVISSEYIRNNPYMNLIPYVYVDAIVEVPLGAHPTACYMEYDYDEKHMREYQDYARNKRFNEYLDKYVYSVDSNEEYLEKIGGMKRWLEIKADPTFGYRP
jgi:acyl CoA:acetate/3-ketoacid CoA transferase alpha subunit